MAAPFQDAIVLFGDSITQQQELPGNMQARFDDAYRRRLDVLNRGYSGYNTRWCRQMFETIFAKKEDAAKVPAVRLVTIWFGANDGVLLESGEAGHQTVPLGEFESNLRYFLEGLTSPTSPLAVAHTPGLNILLITPPPVLISMMGDSPFRNERTPARTRQYADVVVSLGAEYAAKAEATPDAKFAVGTIDMYAALVRAAGGEGEGLAKYLSDGLHLTSEGYAVLWDEYTALVKTAFRGRGLDWEDDADLPRVMPDWDAIDTLKPDVLAGMRRSPIRQ